MAVFPRPSSPKAIWRDLRGFLAAQNRHKLLFATLALAMPVVLIAGFLHDSKREPPKPEMWFVPSWPATRSDAEIVAQQKIDQAKREAAAREKQDSYKRLAKQLGIE